jgi:hypothetical protein
MRRFGIVILWTVGACGGGSSAAPAAPAGPGTGAADQKTQGQPPSGALSGDDASNAVKLFNALNVPAVSQNADCSLAQAVITSRVCGLSPAVWTATVAGNQALLTDDQITLAIAIFNSQKVPAVATNADCSQQVALIGNQVCNLGPAQWTLQAQTQPTPPAEITLLTSDEATAAVALFNRFDVKSTELNPDCTTSSGVISDFECKAGTQDAMLASAAGGTGWTFESKPLLDAEVPIFEGLLNRAQAMVVPANDNCTVTFGMLLETVCNNKPAVWQIVTGD